MRSAFNLRRQTILLSAVPLGFLLALLALAFAILRIASVTGTASEQSSVVLGETTAIMEGIQQADRVLLDYEATPTPRLLAEYQSVRATLLRDAGTLSLILNHDPAQGALAARLVVVLHDAVAVLDEFRDAVRHGNRAQAQAIAGSARVARVGEAIHIVIGQIDDAENASILANLRRLHRELLGFTAALVLCALAGILTTVALAWWFGTRMRRRIDRLAENAQRMALGIFTAPLGGNDELAELDRVYQTLMDRIAHEHHIASPLQHAVLPQELPKLPGLRMDTAYVTAASDSDVGGDWYDAFAISDREIGISIGDVAGHGLRAAALMNACRQTIRMSARSATTPAQTLQHLNAMICLDEPDMLVTAFFARLDVTDGTLRYASAGHPPPFVVRSTGTLETLRTDGIMLGIELRAEFPSHETHLEVGSGLVLYTDGVVEANLDYFDGVHRLSRAITAEYRNASGNIAEAIQSAVLGGKHPQDDAALLFIGITALGERALVPLRRRWTLDARAEPSTRRVQRALLWHLGELAHSDADVSATELIFSELIGNVARHTPGPAEVVLECNGDRAVLRVYDAGEAFSPDIPAEPDLLSEGGRGLFLVQALARQLSVARTRVGNCVSVELPVSLE